MNLFDIIILAALVLFVLSGVRRGMILTVCGLVTAIVALIGAQVAADALSPTVAQMFQPAFESSVQLRLEETLGETDTLPSAGTGQEVIDLAPLLGEDGLLGQMVQSDFYQHFAGAVSETVGNSVESIGAAISAALAQSAAWLVVYLIAFFVIMLLGRLLTGVLNLAAALPGLRFLNKTLGGVCGLIKGVIVLAVLCSLAVGTGLIGQDSVQSSALLSLFAAIRPAGV